MAAALDGALLDREKDMRAADERALKRLQAAGFAFRTVAQAVAYQDQSRASARAAAAALEARLDYFNGRKTA
ncbi:hypothetical protein [Microbacterium oleivorans]|uniref:Uncharacterized protein n=1 Tax=Microbacterium oleivorans TaxID=273677 RepID=A0A4R5YG68_9MICO|nr:hypothetical protein [Microbacterium oleivorans]TDL43856.1 hypothetical protein E2R54_11745 [Microbacterium oleivorans]